MASEDTEHHGAGPGVAHPAGREPALPLALLGASFRVAAEELGEGQLGGLERLRERRRHQPALRRAEVGGRGGGRWNLSQEALAVGKEIVRDELRRERPAVAVLRPTGEWVS